jgi:hypothetical protein
MALAEGDFINESNVDLEYPKWDISVLPGGLKTTHRMLLKMLHAEYIIDQDLQLILYYKREYDNTEEQIPYKLVKEDTFFKQKLPAGILVREWRLELIGLDLTEMKLIELGTTWIAHPIGKR